MNWVVGCGLFVVLLLPGCANRPLANAAPGDSERAAETTGCLLPDGPQAGDFPHLQNLLRVSERLYSGGEPRGKAAFAELSRLGVRTVVSVDGARPQLELADRQGLDYVHIPMGYDGVSREAGMRIARLVRDHPGSIYIHCHHGKHRGPAAAAVACIASGVADGRTALAILKKAGTSERYRGLWRDVEAYVPPAAGTQLPALVPVADVDSLTLAMAQIDRATDHLRHCAAAAWQTPSDHPDLSASQQALLLKEGFRESVRQLVSCRDNSDPLLVKMRSAELAATQLESALQAGEWQMAEDRFRQLQNQCQRCHRNYRDWPQARPAEPAERFDYQSKLRTRPPN